MRTQATGARSLFSLFSSKESVLLLFFLEEKKQKKINCGAAFLLCSCRFPQRAAQNGRFTYEPSVFRSEQDVRESIFSQIDHLSRSVFCFFSSRKEIVPLLFFLEEKNGQLAREAQALRRTDAGTSCVVVGRNTTAGMPPSSALSLPVSAAPARQLSRANRPRKRKSSAEQLPTCAPAAFADVPHKTDGSHTNRPFFRSEQDVRESIFSQIDHLSRSVFCFFSSRKEIVPLLFFLEEKKSFPCRRKENVLL